MSTGDDNLQNLDDKIKKFKAQGSAEENAESKQEREAHNMNAGMRAGAELVVSIGAGVFIGLLLDNWLETKPLFLIIFLLAGIGAGFMNIYRITQNMGSSVGFAALQKDEKDAKNAPVDEDVTKDISKDKE